VPPKAPSPTGGQITAGEKVPDGVEEAGRLDLAEQERQEIDVIREFLPRQLDIDEIRHACNQVVTEMGASGLKDMGKCMGELKQRYAGQMDFGKASGIVKELLI